MDDCRFGAKAGRLRLYEQDSAQEGLANAANPIVSLGGTAVRRYVCLTSVQLRWFQLYRVRVEKGRKIRHRFNKSLKDAPIRPLTQAA
jgi:hypothetical protein